MPSNKLVLAIRLAERKNMKYEAFCEAIGRLCESNGIRVRIETDDKGRFIAHCSSGQKIIGNSVSNKLTIRSGRYHQYQVDIDRVL